MTAEQIRGYAPLSQTISSNTESEDEDDHLAIAEALERREAMMVCNFFFICKSVSILYFFTNKY